MGAVGGTAPVPLVMWRGGLGLFNCSTAGSLMLPGSVVVGIVGT